MLTSQSWRGEGQKWHSACRYEPGRHLSSLLIYEATQSTRCIPLEYKKRSCCLRTVSIAPFLVSFPFFFFFRFVDRRGLSIHIYIWGPITSKSHTHPSHSQTSRLLTSSISLGVPVPRTTALVLSFHNIQVSSKKCPHRRCWRVKILCGQDLF